MLIRGEDFRVLMGCSTLFRMIDFNALVWRLKSKWVSWPSSWQTEIKENQEHWTLKRPPALASPKNAFIQGWTLQSRIATLYKQTNTQKKRKWRRDRAGERKERKRKKRGGWRDSVMKTKEFSSLLAILQIMTRWGKSVSQVGRSGAGADGPSRTSWTGNGKNSLFIPSPQLVTHPSSPYVDASKGPLRDK